MSEAVHPLHDPDILRAGIKLIEASAGTGKTYTIAGLYLRLVVETGLPVEQILVVTFTKAATAELRERIRQRLVAARNDFLAGDSKEEFLAELIERCPDPEQAVRRLERAVVEFDQAAVFTIHSFASRPCPSMHSRAVCRSKPNWRPIKAIWCNKSSTIIGDDS
ncbi:hypothetical protein CAI21_14715 [Alkalilimnicola ehrlichii]|uniref:UvrD-like helicase ATP-binding domain-containing protein n=1 Tax=Alkalilimnicola ehrlichii TaxID=351052 RepID=A0A3E0WN48_9GAMM|nr:UvrD-helicase domain-containing protein [Alkalilimnicola ehrlichii]RFA27291.1 hypothetical protein CAI21_14715 [Alkalilimnicola ehrlichii]RFA34400.1 hypothetical protein CAL65_15285 [Alkalilimnicola ehrlichii]